MEPGKDGAAQPGAQGSGAPAGGTGGAPNADTGVKPGQDAGGNPAGAQGSGKPPDGGKAEGAKAPESAAPFVPKLPDGFKLADEVLKEFNAIFADEKLSPADRQQKLVDLQVKQLQSQERTFKDALDAQPGRDLDALKNDKDFGGANFQRTIDGALRIERLAFGDELGKLLKPLGMQSNPVILKGLARLSRVIADDSVGTNTGNDGSTGTDEDAQGRAMFPKSWDKMKKATGRK